MIQLVNTTATAVSAGSVIPVNLDFNTNENILNFDSTTNAILFVKPGIYKVTANFVLTPDAAGQISVSGYTGINPVPAMIATTTASVVGDTESVSIEKLIKVSPLAVSTKALLNFVVTVASTVNNALISVEKVR